MIKVKFCYNIIYFIFFTFVCQVGHVVQNRTRQKNTRKMSYATKTSKIIYYIYLKSVFYVIDVDIFFKMIQICTFTCSQSVKKILSFLLGYTMTFNFKSLNVI